MSRVMSWPVPEIRAILGGDLQGRDRIGTNRVDASVDVDRGFPGTSSPKRTGLIEIRSLALGTWIRMP